MSVTNEFSFEDLHALGTGLVERQQFEDHPRGDASTEGLYDGFEDNAAIEMERAFEDLHFIETYGMVKTANAAAKMRMCKKLAANYGKGSGVTDAKALASIESLLRVKSMEAEAEANAAGTDTGSDKVDAPADANKTENKKESKVGKFFSGLGQKLAKIFKAIGEFLKKLWDAIVTFFTDVMKKEPPKDATPEQLNTYLKNHAANKEKADKKLSNKMFLAGPITTQKFYELSQKALYQAKNILETLKNVAHKSSHGGGNKAYMNFSKLDQFFKEYQSSDKADGVNTAKVLFNTEIVNGTDEGNLKKACEFARVAKNITTAMESIKKLRTNIETLRNCAAVCELAATAAYNARNQEGFDQSIQKKSISYLRDIARVHRKAAEAVRHLNKAHTNSYFLNRAMRGAKEKKAKESSEA